MISLYEIIEASNGQLLGEVAAQIFEDFCVDVERAESGRLYVAFKSEYGDTHQHIPEAIDRGVSGIICSQPPECDTQGISVILVRDTVEALLAWSHYVIGKFGTKVVVVTGAAGKSVAVDAITRVLQLKYKVHQGKSSETGRLSVPLSLAKLNAAHDFAVLKLGTIQPGVLAAMIEAVQPVAGVVLNVGESHNELFDTPEQVASEKRLLISYLSPGKLAVLNYDDDLVRSMAQAAHDGVIIHTVGMDSFGADMMVYNLVVDHQGIVFDLRYGSERYVQQRIPLFGKYYLYSVMTALTVGLHYDIPLIEGLETLRSIEPLPGRMRPMIGLNGTMLIDDTYGANPQSTLAALDWLEAIRHSDQPVNRIFFIFGDIERLGKYSQSAHRAIGRRVSQVADVIITQGAEAALSARSALDNGMTQPNVHVTYSVQDTISALQDAYELHPDDIILIVGGAFARMENIVRALLQDSEGERYLVRQGSTWESLSITQPTQLSWVDIDTAALANNVRQLKTLIGPDVAMMAVVKSDAYGHGAIITARTALLNGAQYLGVSSIQEALELRDAGIAAPILTMNYTLPQMARLAIQHNITTTIYDLDIARTYNRIAQELGKKMYVHVKVDSGMGRMGAMPDQVATFFRHLMSMDYINIEGIYTHFSTADEDPVYVTQQLEMFKRTLKPLRMTYGYRFKYIHAANSAATLAHPESRLGMVRTGLAMYGMHPSGQVKLPIGFKPVLTWKTSVVQVKTLPKGHPVGYGNTYITPSVEKVAVLPIGYGDGFRRGPQNWGEVLIHGKRAPILGRVSMEKTVVSVQHIPSVSIGDEVVLLGQQGSEIITAEAIAAQIGTNNYEVTCAILPRDTRR